jgi:hypothetical protein
VGRAGTADHVERIVRGWRAWIGRPRRTRLHHELDPGAPGERYQVVVHVDAPALADPEQPGQSVVEDGVHVSAETSRRLACDASRVVMRHDADGRPVEIGARRRTIPPALRRALQHRDRDCRFPGCGRRFTQGHHLQHWAQGGPTTLSNLALLCRRHHPDVPAPALVPADPVQSLRARHEAQGLHLDARTACATSFGERLDLARAIDVLHPLAQRASIAVPMTGPDLGDGEAYARDAQDREDPEVARHF